MFNLLNIFFFRDILFKNCFALVLYLILVFIQYSVRWKIRKYFLLFHTSISSRFIKHAPYVSSSCPLVRYDQVHECSKTFEPTKRQLSIGDQFVLMDCSHDFHRDCIQKWLAISHTCPYRRQKSPLPSSNHSIAHWNLRK